MSNVSRKENLQNMLKQAEAKKLALMANSEGLKSKKERIEVQLLKNEEKIKKLNFFLEKTKKILEGENTTGTN